MQQGADEDYSNWATLSEIISTNNSSVIIRQKQNRMVVEKQVPITSTNRQYAFQQVQLMKQIHSQYVAKYIRSHFNQQNNILSIFMPYYRNGDLSAYLLRNPQLPFQTKMNMFVDILAGIAALHTRFIIHRDLKLKNIFVNQYGECLIGDLGVATVTQSNATSIIGTPGYSAPDVLFYPCQYDQKVDMWGLGIIAFQLFNPVRNGKLKYPFGSIEELTSTTREDTFDYSVSVFDSSVPFKLSYLIQRMLKKDPEERISWVQLYSSDILLKLSKDDARLVSMKAEYKCFDDTKKTLREYRTFIQEFLQFYYQKLDKLLFCRSYRSDRQLCKIVEDNYRDLIMFLYLGMKKMLLKYKYIEDKKVEKAINEFKQRKQHVKNRIAEIQRIVNNLLSKEGEKQISKNKQYLTKQYYKELESKVFGLLYPEDQ